MVIAALLACYQGVIAADTGHVAVHEAGAIEITGHKVLTLPSCDGKISANNLQDYMGTFENDANKDHMVMPGMVYLSQPTEFGTLYSKKELAEIKEICQKHDLKLYIDGARLAYALAAPENDVTLPDLARLCDVFYIGGTKCGAMLGEAVVVPDPKLRAALAKNGYQLLYDSPTNQTFFIMANRGLPAFGQKVAYSFWDKYDEEHTVVRLATSWSSRQEDVDQVCHILAEFKN